MTDHLPAAEPDQTGRVAVASTGTLVSVIVLLQLVASFCYPIAKYGLDIIEPFTFAFYRFMLASVALLIAAAFTSKERRVARKDYPRIVLLGILIIPLNQTLFLVGQSLTGAGHGAFLFATTPIWIFALALIHLKEKFFWRRAIGIAIATIGVVVIMISGGLEVSRDYIIGDLIIILSVIAWAYYTILGKPLVQKYGAIRVTAYALATGSLFYLPVGICFATRYDYSQATPAAWWSVVYMAIGLSLVVYVLWYWVLKQMDASRLAVYHNIQPIIASTVAYVWLGESLSTAFVVGGAIVLAGVVITEIKR
ncbi:MAG: DMT family transporter [bacterium]